ncbi:hypothetical protein GGR57DRAFT_63893 [Xylariaceae sp. FL1272]|nr:hypothetical protein GGR57DRAFT_63893 [Xylariaceae sp. FL1272]
MATLTTTATASLPPSVLHTIVVIERIGSVLSLLGCLVIIITFSTSSTFHKPINRLVFYASFGNILTNIGTLIAMAYVDQEDSAGCQFQGFLIQTFLPADALWTLAMAFNVYLTFYRKFDAARLRGMEKWYLLVCYGIPLVPGLIYIFISNEQKGRIYGDAILWCWVSLQWDVLRVATFYAPVWLVIFSTFFIYIRAGREIYRKRKQLRNFHVSSSGNDPETLAGDDPVMTTEVHITSESAGPAIDLDVLEAGTSSNTASKSHGAPTYSVSISAERKAQLAQSSGAKVSSTARAQAKVRRRNLMELNKATWSYTKCALLFFVALLVTWVPSSANRVYSLLNPGEISAPLEVMSALVLPLQGTWNALIYIVTSWTAFKMYFSDLTSGGTSAPKLPPQFPRHSGDRRNFSFPTRSQHHKIDDSDSVTELAGNARPIANGERKESSAS